MARVHYAFNLLCGLVAFLAYAGTALLRGREISWTDALGAAAGAVIGLTVVQLWRSRPQI